MERQMLKGLGGLAGLGDMAKMMKAATEMQAKIAAMQDDLSRIVVTGEAGAGLVKARATAKGEVTGLDIDPSILVASEKEVVEDLILAAIHDAQGKARAKSDAEMKRLAEEMGVPPGMKLPF
jgi:nucleoid-associated protein EbfC